MKNLNNVAYISCPINLLDMGKIKPSITAKGFRIAVKDYSEASVIEELAANSYDEDATTVIVLLDDKSNVLYILDDGKGFDSDSVEEITSLGGSDKATRPYASGNRIYLGSYGYGLKATLNVSSKFDLISASKNDNKIYKATVDWNILDEALKDTFDGYDNSESPKKSNVGNGSIIKLYLKNPTDKTHLDAYAKALSNLPNDGGNFKCYYGFFGDIQTEFNSFSQSFKKLKETANSLYNSNKLKLAVDTYTSELTDCVVSDMVDKEDKTISAKFYFAGLQNSKVKPLKSALRGIYVRVHDRLLKHNFSENKYTYNITKYNSMFSHGLRVELNVDWLRDQISLSRDDIKFSNSKLEKDFTAAIGRLVARFIRPNLDKLNKVKSKVVDDKLKQRLQLAKKRTDTNQQTTIKGITNGFNFIPETDAELAILLSQPYVINKVDSNYKLIDYNDKHSFDCLIWDASIMDLIYTELEPTLIEFLEHNNKEGIALIIVWTLGKWRVGSKHKGKGGYFGLITHSNGKKGHHKLLEYPSETSLKPRLDYHVIVLDEIL